MGSQPLFRNKRLGEIPSEMLQNLPFPQDVKTQAVFGIVHFVQFYFPPNECSHQKSIH